MKVTLSAIAIELGEREEHYAGIEGVEELIGKYALTNKADYWGWGNYRRTGRSSLEMARSAIVKSLDATSVARADIDLVIYCSAGTGEPYHVVNENLGHMLKEIGLPNVQVLGQNFLGCVSIFSAIDIANELLKSGSKSNILVVTADKIASGVVRFREFGIYSDSASCFLLSAKVDEGFELLGCSQGSDAKLMAGEMENSDSHFQNLQRIHSGLFDKLAYDVQGMSKIFFTNIYKPLLQINTARLGYKQPQHFNGTIQRYGHCFSSDPILNLVTCTEEHETEEESVYVLGAMALGHAGFCAVKKLDTPSELII